MKRFKKSSMDKRRKFNILLSAVALVLVLVVGGYATYSWVEQSTSLDIQMNGDIQRVPGGNTAYNHQITLDKDSTNLVSLNDYVDKVDDIHLSPVSSADGQNFFMKGTNNTTKRAGSTSDASVSYLAFDFDVTATTATTLYFDDGEDSNGNQDLTNHPKPSFIFAGSSTEAKSVRVAVKVGSGTPLIFSQTGDSYTALTSTSGGTSTVTPHKFDDYIFGHTALCSLAQNTKTKIRITVWIEGTDANLNSEFNGNALAMKLMLTTPWPKSAQVKFIDKTANTFIYNGSGTLKVNNVAMTKNTDGTFSGRITMSDSSCTFTYTVSGTTYTWSAGAVPENTNEYTAFDYATSNSYGKWAVETEKIYIMDCLVGTDANLAHNGNNAIDTHCKVSTDGSNYYRTAYNSTKGAWQVYIDKNYTYLYVQNCSSAGTVVDHKWNASGKTGATGRTNTATMDTYYLIGSEYGSSAYSTGTWTDNALKIYFYDGTVDQKIYNNGTTINYKAYSSGVQKSAGTMTRTSTYEYYTTSSPLNYTYKIDRVEFIVNVGANSIVYTWDGTNRPSNTDIYYTATSYTKD